MYDDDDRDDLELDNEECEYCPFYRQQPPIFGPAGLQFPPLFGPEAGLEPGTRPTDGPPKGPPPSVKPNLTQTHGASVKAIDPGAIRRCRNRFVYMRLDNGSEFWAWLTFVGVRSVAGWRWNRFRWVYFGVDLRRIAGFHCH